MCTCEQPTFVTPAPGSVDVPTNAELFIADPGPTQVTVIGGGESVVVDLQQLGALRYAYQGALSLAPGTTYEIHRGLENEVVTTFTTGSGPDDTPPPAASFRRAVPGARRSHLQ